MFSFLSGLSNLQQRFIAGIIGGAIVINAIYWTEWGYFSLFFGICLLANLEFYDLLIADKKKPNKVFGTMIGMSIYTLIFVIEKKFIPSKFYLLLFPLCAIVFIYEMYNSQKKPFNNVAYTILGVLYVSIPFSVMHIATFGSGQYSWQTCLGCLFLLWASDSGAYFAGKNFGRHKLFLRVSPGKTWEGSIGGGITSVGVAILISNYFTDLQMWQWISLAVIIVVAGSYGDLVESSFKRSLKIKDSGSAIPGHGGFLDRFDGWLLSAPFIATFLRIVSQFPPIQLSHSKIILASASPRRKELLAGLGFTFEVIPSNVEEVYPEDLALDQVPEFLAKLKADSLSKSYPNHTIISADTVVILENEILGKPSNEEEAKQMLRKLSGKKHEVVTGVCIIENKIAHSFSDSTYVYFKELTDSEIAHYVQQFKPMDKAGSYGVQEWIGYVAVEKIEGSFYNVMGLPVNLVYRKLSSILFDQN